MKTARQYVQEFKAAGETNEALGTIVMQMLREVAELGKVRGIQFDSALFSILNEIDLKWRVFAKECSRVNPDGFMLIQREKMPDVYSEWMQDRRSRGMAVPAQ